MRAVLICQQLLYQVAQCLLVDIGAKALALRTSGDLARQIVPV
jgi:hypothetical protein